MSDLDFGKELIKKKIPLVSNSPGVYRMLGKKNQVLYVGKAKNLPKRLKDYAMGKNLTIRTNRMLALTHNLEIVTTSSEAEALLLEANLIKKFKPKFNILLKDDKSFPYIFIEKDCDWPQLSKHRGAKNKNGYYFGPFASVGSANWTIKILQKVFLLRVCNDSAFKNRDRACILFQIKRCAAPCMDYVSKNDYAKLVNDAVAFLSGKSKIIQKKLSLEMEKNSKKMDYEKAAIIRDRIKALTQIQSSQNISSTNLNNADVISISQEATKSCIQIFFYRSKQNWGNQSYFPKHDPDQNISEIMSSFIMQFYENKNVPKLIILNLDIKDKKLIEQTLSAKDKKNISITIAKKGTKAKVVSLAEKNAKESLNRKLYETNNNKNLFEGISKKFNLKNNVSLVEVYDNSHIQGTSSVGAMVAFGDEGFIKKRYRKFDIKTKNSEQDDYAMLREVLNRRFKRAILKKENYLTFPDLLLIDGGKGQYSTAREVLNELGLYDIPIIAIAKGKLRNSGNETFFFENKAFKFNRNDPILFFLQRLRDEAHRFAITSHKTRRSKISKSILDEVEGIGPNKKRDLLKYFGSSEQIKIAQLSEIEKVKGINKNIAKKIYNFFHEN